MEANWTAEELIQYGTAMALRRGFHGDSVEDAAQEFAVGAWLAQQKLDPEKGTGRGFVTRGGLNGMKHLRRYNLKHLRVARKAVEDIDGDTFEYEEVKVLSGDYNSEDGEGSLSVWDTVADQKAVNPLEAAVTGDALQNAHKALQCLNSKQREVILARAEGETLQAIADRMGVSREYVRQVEESARKTALLALA